MVKIAATVERAPPLSLWPGKTPPGGWGKGSRTHRAAFARRVLSRRGCYAERAAASARAIVSRRWSRAATKR